MKTLIRKRIQRRACPGLISIIFMACVITITSGSSPHVLKCVASIPPLASVLEDIGGASVSVYILINKGQNPHTFEPTPGQIKALISSDILFTVGLPFETAFLSHFQGPKKKFTLCDTSAGSILIKKNPRNKEEKNGFGEENHHIWLSPKNLTSIAQIINMSLKTADPSRAKSYHARTMLFIKKLDNVHRKNIELLSPLQGKSFSVLHPSFGYFADAYNLQQFSLEVSGKPPTPRELVRLIHHLKRHGERVIFVQPQFDLKSVKTIANSMEIEVRILDPLARDVLETLEVMGLEISRALSKKGL